MERDPFTVGKLRRAIAYLDDDAELEFAGGLSFYRVKQRGENLHVIEFGEATAYLTEAFKRRNPNVKVAFIDTGKVKWNEEGTIGGPIDVEVR